VRVAFGRQRTARPTALTFRELETFPRAGLTGFFALLHARIPAEQTLSFQRGSQIAIDLKKSARDRKLRGAGLSHNATTRGVNRQIIGIHRLGSLKGLQHDVLQGHSGKKIFEGPNIDIDLSATRRHPDARDRCFAATRGNEFLSFWHKIIFW
jgi:hypothetical protein